MGLPTPSLVVSYGAADAVARCTSWSRRCPRPCVHCRSWTSNYSRPLWATTLPRVWWTVRSASPCYMSSAIRDDNILSCGENQRANIICGTLPTEFVALQDGNESLRYALDTVHRVSTCMCGQLDNVRRGTDHALRLANDVILVPAVHRPQRAVTLSYDWPTLPVSRPSRPPPLMLHRRLYGLHSSNPLAFTRNLCLCPRNTSILARWPSITCIC